MLSTVLLLGFTALHAVETRDSIDFYQNHTVSGSVVLQGRSTLTLINITVTSTGSLTASAPDGVVIAGTLDVQLGGELELNGGNQFPLYYTYDNSGNVTSRKDEE